MGNMVTSLRVGTRTQDRRVRELALDAISVMAFSIAVCVCLVCGVVVMTHLVS